MTSKFNRFLPILVVAILLTSCGANTSKNEVKTVSGTPIITYDTTLKSGAITEKVVCKNDANVSYALYLPSTYKAGNEYPAIYIFDPHADGFLPVNTYRDLAEKYGYILIGSYNSKNGMPWDAVHQSIKTMFDDSESRLAIDKNRIYTAGFSGGSRVASSVAIYDGGIRGVIGCSAGFPQLNKQLENKFDFIGIAGNEDFNMTEMKNLDKNLDATALRHTLIIFDGKHEWASPTVFEEAFQWILLNEMKDKMVATNTAMVDEIKQSYHHQIIEKEGKGKPYEALLLYKRMLSFLDGITDIAADKKSMDSLSALDVVKKITVHKTELEKQELEIQQHYGQAFTQKDINWWMNEVKQLNAKTKSADAEVAQMYKRIMGYLSLVAYSQANNALNSNHLDQAELFIKLYALIDPPNSEHSYMDATLFSKKHESDKVIPALKEAVKLGFNDIARLQNDAAFSSLKNNKDYTDLVSEINQKLP